MSTRRFGRHLAIALMIYLGSIGYAKDEQDDFSQDSGLWQFSSGGGKGHYELRNGRLEFTTQGGFTRNDSKTCFWKTPIGRYDESWEVQADVYLGSFPPGNPNPYAGLALLVGNKASSPLRSFIRVQLRKGTNGRRAFNADAHRGHKYLGSKWEDTSADKATLRIQFDATSKMLTASYDADGSGAAADFVSFYSINIGSGAENWHMRSDDVFEFSIVGQSVHTVVAAGDMCFDNVLVRNKAYE